MASSAVSDRIAAFALCAALAACGGKPADLSTEQLAKVVAAQQPTLKVCFDAELERAPSTITMQFDAALHVAPSGRVSSVEFAPGAASEPLLKCLRNAIARWTFPRAEEPTHASLPLVFKPEVVRSGPNLDDVQNVLKQLRAADPAQAPPKQP